MSLSAVAQTVPPVASVMEEQPGSSAPLRHEERARAEQTPKEQSCLGAVSRAIGHVAFAVFSAIPIIGMAGYAVTSYKAEKAAKTVHCNPKDSLKALIPSTEWDRLAALAAKMQTSTGLALIPILLFKLGILSLAVAWPIGVGLLALGTIVSVILFIKQGSDRSKILVKKMYVNLLNNFQSDNAASNFESTYKKLKNEIKKLDPNVFPEICKLELIQMISDYKSEKIIKNYLDFFVKNCLGECSEYADVAGAVTEFNKNRLKFLGPDHKNQLGLMIQKAAYAKEIRLLYGEDVYSRPNTNIVQIYFDFFMQKYLITCTKHDAAEDIVTKFWEREPPFLNKNQIKELHEKMLAAQYAKKIQLLYTDETYFLRPYTPEELQDIESGHYLTPGPKARDFRVARTNDRKREARKALERMIGV